MFKQNRLIYKMAPMSSAQKAKAAATNARYQAKKASNPAIQYSNPNKTTTTPSYSVLPNTTSKSGSVVGQDTNALRQQISTEWANAGKKYTRADVDAAVNKQYGLSVNNGVVTQKNPYVESEEDRAKNLLAGSYDVDAINKYVKDTYGVDLAKGSPTDLESYLKLVTESGKKNIAAQEKADALAEQNEFLQGQDFAKQAKSAEAATIAGMAQGREGVMSAGKPMVVSQFSENLNRARQERQLSLQSASLQRSETMRRLQEAQAENNYSLATKLKGQLAEQEAKVQALNNETIQLELQAQTTEANVQKTRVETLSGILSSMDPATLDRLDVTSMATQAGIPVTAALGMKELAKINVQIATAKSEAERDELSAKAQQLQMEVDAGLYGTAETKEFQFYNKLSDDQKTEYQNWKNMGYDFVNVDGVGIVKVDKSTGNASVAFSTEDLGGSGTVSGEWGSVEDALSQPDGMPIDPTTGEPAVDSWNKKKGSVQCAQFVNRYTGLGMGNDYGSKADAIRPYLVDSPQPGDVFVSPYTPEGGKPIGHAGFVVSVSADGKNVTVKDANSLNDGQIRTHVMSTQGMLFGRLNKGSKAKETALSIMNGSSKLTLKDLPVKERAEVDKELNKLKDQALSSGDFEGVMKASAGGVNPGETFKTSMKKGSTVINQLSALSNLMLEDTVKDKDTGDELDLSPLSGWLAEKNPWDTDAQEIQAIIQATIPNLARGVYGEVGVLTDNDVNLYKKTIPNLRSTDDVKKAVLAMTLITVRDSLKAQIEIEAASGSDMSGFTRYYKDINDKINSIESDIGIAREGTKPKKTYVPKGYAVAPSSDGGSYTFKED